MARSKEPAKKPEVPKGEIAASVPGRDITKGFAGLLTAMQAEDPLLLARGQDLRLYEDVARDDQVIATFQQRRMAVTAREWRVEAGGDTPLDQEAAAHLEAQLKRLSFDRLTEKMLWGVFYGYAVAELIWGEGADGLWRIEAVKVRNRRRFAFAAGGALTLKTQSAPMGEALPERKFWVFSAGADHDDDPYGRGLGYWLFWPVWFKRNGTRFWAKFLEKFGAPTAKGSYPRNASKADTDKLLAALRALQESAAIIYPEGMSAELIEAGKSAGDHAVFTQRMDEAVSKIVLSQTMTTDDGASRAQGQVHFDVRQEIAKADADLICESFSAGPAAWLTQWNFPGAKPPRVFRLFEEPEDLDAASTRDQRLMQMGFEPDEGYIKETYGDHWTRKAPPEVPPGALAPEPGQDARNAPGGISGPAGRNPRPLGPLNALKPAAPGQADPTGAFSEGQGAGTDPRRAFLVRLQGASRPAMRAALAAAAAGAAGRIDDPELIDAQTEAFAAAAEAATQGSLDRMIGRVRSIVDGAESLEAVRDGLAALAGEAFSARDGAEATEAADLLMLAWLTGGGDAAAGGDG